MATYRISVNHSEFEKAASAVDTYVRLLKNSMRSAQSEVTMMLFDWTGSDFSQFKTEFNKVDNDDSTHSKFVKSMESYAKYLRYAGNSYKNAQSRAVNRAKNLPRG